MPRTTRNRLLQQLAAGHSLVRLAESRIYALLDPDGAIVDTVPGRTIDHLLHQDLIQQVPRPLYPGRFRGVRRSYVLTPAGEQQVRTTAPDRRDWDALNARRIALIQQQTRQKLTPDEQAELRRLQDQASAFINTHYPLPPGPPDL